MNTGPKSVENKEKTKSPTKENNSESKEFTIVNKDNEKNNSDKYISTSKKKLFMTSTIIPVENCPSSKNNNCESEIQFIITTSTDFHKENKEKKEKENSKNNPLLITKIEESNLNIFNNYIIFNYS